MRDQVDQFLAFAGHAFQTVAGQLQPDVRPDPRQQFLGNERLGDVVDRAGLERAQQELAVLGGGEEDRRHLAHAGLVLQRGQQFEPVHARHHHVEQHQVGRGGPRGRQRFGPIACGGHRIAVAFQQRADHPQVRGLVVDDEDAAGAGFRMRHAGGASRRHSAGFSHYQTGATEHTRCRTIG